MNLKNKAPTVLWVLLVSPEEMSTYHDGYKTRKKAREVKKEFESEGYVIKGPFKYSLNPFILTVKGFKLPTKE